MDTDEEGEDTVPKVYARAEIWTWAVWLKFKYLGCVV